MPDQRDTLDDRGEWDPPPSLNAAVGGVELSPHDVRSRPALDEVGEHHDVVDVRRRGAIEDAAADDQVQLGQVARVAVRLDGGELVLEVALDAMTANRAVVPPPPTDADVVCAVIRPRSRRRLRAVPLLFVVAAGLASALLAHGAPPSGVRWGRADSC
jgi:hypothetical protein